MRIRGRKSWVAVSCLAATALLATTARAQVGGGPGRGPAPRDPERRAEIEQTLEIYMVTKMKRFLDLTVEQEKVMIPLMEDLNASRKEMREQHRQIMQQLKPLVVNGDADEEEIALLLEDMDRLERDRREMEDRVHQEIRQTLTTRQQALFRVFQENFHREIRSRMRRLERDGRPPREGRPDSPRPPR